MNQDYKFISSDVGNSGLFIPSIENYSIDRINYWNYFTVDCMLISNATAFDINMLNVIVSSLERVLVSYFITCEHQRLIYLLKYVYIYIIKSRLAMMQSKLVKQYLQATFLCRGYQLTG